MSEAFYRQFPQTEHVTMDFSGRYSIAAPPQAVWDGLNDPDVLKSCITGCEQLEKTSPTDFAATVKLKIGPVSATFKGKVTLSELDPPHRCVLAGEGQGGVAGFAKGSAEVVLTPEGNGTVLTYTANASVGGKLAQIGQRLIDGAAKQIADDFFKRFAAAIAPALSADPTTAELVAGEEIDALCDMTPGAGSAEAAGIAMPPIPPARGGLTPQIWVVGLIAVVVILLVLFGVVL